MSYQDRARIAREIRKPHRYIDQLTMSQLIELLSKHDESLQVVVDHNGLCPTEVTRCYGWSSGGVDLGGNLSSLMVMGAGRLIRELRWARHSTIHPSSKVWCGHRYVIGLATKEDRLILITKPEPDQEERQPDPNDFGADEEMLNKLIVACELSLEECRTEHWRIWQREMELQEEMDRLQFCKGRRIAERDSRRAEQESQWSQLLPQEHES